jgi:cell wall-associated NlpC family hydrolase
MEKYICDNVFVPLRSGPSHRSEMLSEVLFGEKYTIIDQVGHWIKVETEFDNFQGWIDMDHVHHSVVQGDSCGHVLNKNLLCYKSDKTKIVLEPGCDIYSPDFEEKTFFAGNNIYTTGREFNESFITTGDSLPDTAMKFINSPYIWGGRIPSGIDCSGLTQLVYKIHGIKIKRNSWQQAESGTEISFIDETMPGDLVFFDDDHGTISHVGMIVSRGLVIHASGRVRIDSIDHQGIFRQESGKYTHHLRMIKRLIP